MSQHETNDVAARHQHEGNRTGFVDNSFSPAIYGGQFAHVAFDPAERSCSVPSAHQVQGDTCYQNSNESDHEIRQQIDVGDRSKQISIPRTKYQHQGRTFIDKRRSNVAAYCSDEEQQRSQCQDCFTHAEHRS